MPEAASGWTIVFDKVNSVINSANIILRYDVYFAVARTVRPRNRHRHPGLSL